MNQELIKRYSLLEIALLAVFAAGLFCAFIIVKTSRKIVLSEPIELADSGITVSLPVGPDWESNGLWQFKKDNSVNLIADHMGYRNRDIQVRWRYVLASELLTPEQLLQKHAESMNTGIQEILQTSGPHPMHYTRFYLSQQEEGFELILGILPLDFGRRIELYVRGYHPFDDTYEHAFFALAGQLRYKIPEDLDRGLEVLAAFTANPAAFSHTQDDSPEAFIVKDARDRNCGYATFEKAPYRFQSRYFEISSQRRQSNLWFRRWPDEMFWKTTVEFHGAREPAAFNIQTDADRNLVIKGDLDSEQTFFCDHFILPRMLLTEFARAFLNSAHDQICIDTLTYRGGVYPARLSKIAVDQAHARSEELASVVRIEYPFSEGLFEEIYFDESQNIVGKFINTSPRRIQLWEATTVPQLQEFFQENYQQSAAPFACVNVMDLNYK